ncbi:hypothetical protein HHI36_011294 [Cryptolaemus montrouzieri]|uniref:PWWP domain-containing protein n=1 Tax=Cryptolaemus montrouzieri TaxID=559131 RepID=A0ABD2MLE8_9CUCU
MSDKFEIGDLVWAKLKGYPPWPARVVKPSPTTKKPSKKNMRWIYFFGSENYAWIEPDQIKPYYEYKEQLSNAKYSSFKQAMEKIEEYIDKKKADPTYELDMPEVKKKKTETDDATPKKVSWQDN